MIVEGVFADTVDEADTSDEFGDVLVTSQFSPALLGTLSQLEDHHQ